MFFCILVIHNNHPGGDMSTILVTGFKRSGGYLSNPTETLLDRINETKIGGYRIKTLVFPAEVAVGFGYISVNTALLNQATIILSLGLWSSIRGVQLEKFCQNWVDNVKYCPPSQNNQPVSKHEPPKEIIEIPSTGYDIQKFSSGLNGWGLELFTSNKPSGFCCNSLAYSTMCAIRGRALNLGFTFLHVPCTNECILPEERKGKFIITEEQLLGVVESFIGAVY